MEYIKFILCTAYELNNNDFENNKSSQECYEGGTYHLELVQPNNIELINNDESEELSVFLHEKVSKFFPPILSLLEITHKKI